MKVEGWVCVPSVDGLSNIIRAVDGTNTLGAGALAEAIIAAAPTEGAPVLVDAETVRVAFDLIRQGARLLRYAGDHGDAKQHEEIAAKLIAALAANGEKAG